VSSDRKVQILRGVLYDLHEAQETLNTVTSAPEAYVASRALEEAIRDVAYILSGVDYQVLKEERIAQNEAIHNAILNEETDLINTLNQNLDMLNKASQAMAEKKFENDLRTAIKGEGGPIDRSPIIPEQAEELKNILKKKPPRDTEGEP
jgi:hypothetical protein